MRTFAVVVNWNNPDDTVNCVRSLLSAREAPHRIIVVDNGSTDASVAVLNAQLDGLCHIIPTGKNLGYAGGLRVGADYSMANGADLIWFMNDDILVLPDTLTALLASVERNGLWCLYNPKILYHANRDRTYFAGYYQDRQTGLFCRGSSSRPSQYGADRSDLISDVIQGANFLVPVEVIRELGFMAEDFFLYYEEFDYSLRLARHGVKCICVLPAIALHKRDFFGEEHSDSPAMKRIRAYYRVRNPILLWRRNYPLARTVPWIWRHFWRQLAAIIKARGFPETVSQVRVEALWHGLIGKAGPVYRPG